MAAYYGGDRVNYNPRGTYFKPQTLGNEVVSLYNPQTEAAYIDAIAKRQQRFDVGVAGAAKERARIGEVETYDPDLLKSRLSDFESNVNSLVQDKYNGDYSVAANELSMLVANERAHPFYQFNKHKVEAVKQSDAIRQKLGANYLSTGDPRDVTYKDWQNGESFDFTPVNKNDVISTASIVGQNLSRTLRENPDEWKQILGGQYYEKLTQSRFANEAELNDFLAKPEGEAVMNEIYNTMPELSKVTDQNAVHNSIKVGLYNALGQSKSEHLANRGYNTEPTTEPTGGFSSYIIQPKGSETIQGDYLTSKRPELVEARNNISKALAEEFNIPNINSWEDLKKVDDKRINENIMTAIYNAVAGGITPFGALVISNKNIRDNLYNKTLGLVMKDAGVSSVSVDFGHKVKKALQKAGISPDWPIELYHINPLASSDPTIANKIKTLNTVFNNYAKKNLRDLEGMTKEDKRGLEAIIKSSNDVNIDGFRPTDEGLMLHLSGSDDKNNPIDAGVVSKDATLITEMMGYVLPLISPEQLAPNGKPLSLMLQAELKQYFDLLLKGKQ